MIDYRMYHLELMNAGEPDQWQEAKCEDAPDGEGDGSLLDDITVRDLNQGFRESKPKPKLSVNASPSTNMKMRISLSTQAKHRTSQTKQPSISFDSPKDGSPFKD